MTVVGLYSMYANHEKPKICGAHNVDFENVQYTGYNQKFMRDSLTFKKTEGK